MRVVERNANVFGVAVGGGRRVDTEEVWNVLNIMQNGVRVLGE